MVYILAAILIFGVLIAVHEFGHFLAAKACGVRVNEFSIGMGPRLLHKTKGETEYSVRLLPIGGFCAMEGEEEDSDDPNALNNKGFWAKLLIFVAGAFMNFVLGFLVLLAIVGLYLLSCMGASGINVGDILLMGCALAFAVQITLIDRFAPEADGMKLNCIQALVVTALSAPFMLLTETVEGASILACWPSLAFAGILSTGVAYTLQIVSQKNLEPTAASLIMSLESVFAALGGWLVLDETMTPWELTGCALVFCAVILSQLTPAFSPED